MDINRIREKISSDISASSDWIDKLDNTNPGHYGIEEWDVLISPEDIWVDIPSKTFKFKNVQFVFQLTIGGSNDGTSMKFKRIASGNGCFEFSKTNEIEIVNTLEIEMNLDLFTE